jgi:hypothetical protein
LAGIFQIGNQEALFGEKPGVQTGVRKSWPAVSKDAELRISGERALILRIGNV